MEFNSIRFQKQVHLNSMEFICVDFQNALYRFIKSINYSLRNALSNKLKTMKCFLDSISQSLLLKSSSITHNSFE